jgi:hypothetical protein
VSDLPEHDRRNRAQSDAWASQFVPDGEAAWARDTRYSFVTLD